MDLNENTILDGIEGMYITYIYIVNIYIHKNNVLDRCKNNNHMVGCTNNNLIYSIFLIL